MKKPNLVFIMTDQMRRDIGIYGNTDVITPNLDSMGNEGAIFERAYCCAPQCTPARACMLTGTYPSFHKLYINDYPFSEEILEGKKSIAYELAKAGYKTGYIGKWHLFGSGHLRDAYIPEGVHRLGFNDLWAVTNCCHDYRNNSYYLNDQL